VNPGFELLKEQEIKELQTLAKVFCHVKTGAQVLSLIADDENKVFGIAFRTPPSDSTGLPHILEHSVLCGSRKFPVKEPFVELLKGSLQTFLNAFTYPDKTCYPVASQNLQDFYNLMDVYLDAVFYPRITRAIFEQEGWHFELDDASGPLLYKGVVYNEMKGAYSSPDNRLSEYSLQSLFPDTAYGLDSGGDPKQIPNLDYEQFRAFHRKYYHPSNARIFFYGDDDPDERLRRVQVYLDEFDPIDVDSHIRLQTPFGEPKRVMRPFMAGEETGKEPKGMITLNWVLPETTDVEANFALHVLTYILLGMPGSPLRKALIDSGLGEDIAGDGLGSELRQITFSTGLKGIDTKDSDKVEGLILQTLDQ
jgi:Zn-dependent M16 (insulinase) family peptidase